MRNQPISQWSAETIGLAVYDMGILADADDPPGVTLGAIRVADGSQAVAPGTLATWDDIGLYSYVIPPSGTATQGEIIVTWDWEMAGDPRTFQVHYDVVDPQPYWDRLDEAQRQIVVNVYHKVSDGFDSTEGGPYLWELPQSHFGYETVAKLMVVDAMTYINLAPQKAWIPPYTVGRGSPRPFPAPWYGLLEKATYYHLLRHLERSYLEQPDPQNVSVARLDRRDYSQRWGFLADKEKVELDQMIKFLKRTTYYAVKSRASLLAGGIFPISYLDPARPRWPYVVARF